MSASTEFIKHVKDLLAPLGPLSTPPFFGGYAFKQNERQFAMVMGNSLYFCVDAASQPAYERQGMAPFSYLT